MAANRIAIAALGLAACSAPAPASTSAATYATFGAADSGGTTDTGASDGIDRPADDASTASVADGSSGRTDTGESTTDMPASTDGGASTGAIDPSTTGATATTGEIDPDGCIDGDLGSALGSGLVTGDTTGASDDVALDCADGGGADLIYTWTAPADGSYVFALDTPSYDTAIQVLTGDCQGPVGACNDDTPLGQPSRLYLDLAAGEQVLVVIDGYAGSTGAFSLDIYERPVPELGCVDAGDLGSATGAVATASTVGAGDEWANGCVDGGPDVVYVWTAPWDNYWTFSLVDVDYDAAISIVWPDCNGDEVACNDNGENAPSEIVVPVGAGDRVLVVVDGAAGASGNFTLTIG